MGWLSPLRRIFGSKEEKSTGWLDDLWAVLSRRYQTRSGMNINLDTALQCSVVLACARVTAEDTASNPWRVVKETPSGYQESAFDHPLYDVLEFVPNPWQSGMELRETMIFQAALCGQAFSLKNMVRDQIKELLPFEPGVVQVDRNADMTLSYRAATPSGEVKFSDKQMWHLRGPSMNGWMGVDTVRLAREAIGLAIATEEAHGLLHANGLQTTGVIGIDGNVDNDQHKKLTLWIEQHMTGENKFKPLILDRGAKWFPRNMTGVDAQHIETRRFQIEEICRAMRVVPIMVGHSDKVATYASAEQMFIAHNNNIGKWCRRVDKSGERWLLTKADRAAGYRLRHQINALMYADIKTKASWYTALYMIGAITPNQIRGFENMSPYDDGDQYRVPANMIDPATEAAAVTAELRKMLTGEVGDILREGALEAKMADVFQKRAHRRVFTSDPDMLAYLARIAGEQPQPPTVH